jgi:hypothetical protein
MNNETKLRRYHETLDRVASDLAAAKLTLEEVRKRIDRDLAVDRSAIIDIKTGVNSTLQAVLSLLRESSPFQREAEADNQKQAGSRSAGVERLTATEVTALRKISLKKVWHAGKQWKGGGVIGWESAPPEKGSPYQLRLEGGMVLETSPVQAVEKTSNAWIIRTLNSVYQLIELEEIPQGEGEQTGTPPKKPKASEEKDRRLKDTRIKESN